MNKAVIVGIVVSAIIIGILIILSLDSFSNLKDNGFTSEPILEKDGEELVDEPKPSGRNLSIELDENMGLSAP